MSASNGAAARQQQAVVDPAQVALLDDQLAALDHVPRGREHLLAVGAVVVDRHVGVGADPEVALVAQAEPARGRGAGDDRDLVQRVLAVEAVEQRGAPIAFWLARPS